MKIRAERSSINVYAYFEEVPDLDTDVYEEVKAVFWPIKPGVITSPPEETKK